MSARVRGAARAVALTAAALLAGCESGTEPTRESPTLAFVHVSVLGAARADTLGTANVSANVVPGRDARGVPREVTTTLVVGGRTLAFGPPTDDFGTRYVQTSAIRLPPALGAQPLAIELPTVAGVTANRPRVRTTTVRALDGDTVRVGADGALRLRLVLAPGDDAPSMRQWTLSVTGAQSLTYRGTGLPPTEIVVPRELLPAPTPAGQWRAQLDVQEGHGFEYGVPVTPVTVPPYDARVLFQQLVLWTVGR